MKDASVVAIIPARFDSRRLPGKPLLDIAGRPMILHVLDRARQARGIDQVLVATDDQRVFDAVAQHGGEARLTSHHHQSGTERVAEVAATLRADLVINLQGDEPLISPRTIEAALAPILRDESIDICTTSEPMERPAEVFDSNVVKVVSDRRGFALYFSRAPIPYCEPETALEHSRNSRPEWFKVYRKHTGLYVYRRECLLRLGQLEPSPLELRENLEQLRALEHGIPIRVVPVSERSIGVDTPGDLQRVRHLMEVE